ncbi:hypothetical protein FOQG_18975, partial [Fusarium oxysporum f. sp. raphani 54005]
MRLFTNFSYPDCTSVVTGGMWGQRIRCHKSHAR